MFDDAIGEPTYEGGEFTGLLKLGRASVYLSWTVNINPDKKKLKEIEKQRKADEKATKKVEEEAKKKAEEEAAAAALLAKEEEENNEGKPDRPKVIFPTREVCPVCFVDPYSDVYSKDDVFEYLKLSYFNVHRAMPGDYKNTMEQEIPPWLSDDMPLEDPRALHDEFAEAIREKEKVMKKMNKHGNHSVVKVLGGVVGVVVACLVLLYIFVHNDAASKKRQNKYY